MRGGEREGEEIGEKRERERERERVAGEDEGRRRRRRRRDDGRRAQVRADPDELRPRAPRVPPLPPRQDLRPVHGARLRELPLPRHGKGSRQRRQLHHPQLHRNNLRNGSW